MGGRGKAPPGGGGKKGRSLPKRLTKEEAARLLKLPNTRVPTGCRNRALLRCYYRAGLRCNEALDLTVRDVQLDKREIRVNDGKGGKDRVVWIDERTAEILRSWRDRRAGELRARGAKSDFFFCTLDGGRLEDSYVRHLVARLGRKAGIEVRVHPHLLRHTYATELLEEGFKIHEVQKLLGHNDLQTTSIYLHVADEDLRERLAVRS